MNYEKIYNSLIQSRKPQGLDKSKLDGYYEIHHIVPRCLGGSDEESNLVLLTGREHYIAHLLLTKFTAGAKHLKCLHALAWFQTDKDLNSRQISKAREANSLANSIRMLELCSQGLGNLQTPEAREAAYKRGRELAAKGEHPFQSAEARKARSEQQSKLNLKLSSEGKHPAQSKKGRERAAKSLRETNRKMLAEGRHISQSTEAREATTRRLLALAAEGKHPSQSVEAKVAFVKRMSTLNNTRRTCPFCKLIGRGPNMKRYHFSNCKQFSLYLQLAH